MSRLRFGVFLAPIHNLPRQSLHLALHRDVELAQRIEQLGYDEMWFGEHHSAGTEWIASPEVFISYVAAKTQRLKLGSGAISVPYHNPFHIAERALLLDHLTHGRFILGVGPGSLGTDAHVLGLDMTQLRDVFEHDIDIVMRLIHHDEPVTVKTDKYELVEARCMLKPYSEDGIELAVPSVASAIAPRVAGKWNGGIISLGSSTKEGGDALVGMWNALEARAREFGHTPDRRKWRLTSHMHIAETKEQAMQDIQKGFMSWFDYYAKNTSHPRFVMDGTTFEERFEFLETVGAIVVGTPDDAIAEIQKFVDQTGGFGSHIQFHHEWTDWAAMLKHHELFAQYVIPHFQDQFSRNDESYRWATAERARNLEEMTRGFDQYAAKHGTPA